MNKPIAVILGLLIAGTPVFAAEAGQKEKEARQKILDEKINGINETEWKVLLTPDHPKLKPVEDVLSFRGHTVQMTYFEKKGYKPTNYTVTLEDEEGQAANWETMKTHPEGGGKVVYLRGQWNGDRMSGVATEKNPDAKDQEITRYVFAGSPAGSALSAEKPGEVPGLERKEGSKAGTAGSSKILKSEETKLKK